MKYLSRFLIALALMAGTSAWAQLPPDAVQLGKVKIPEAQKAADLDPVTLEAADPALGTFEHDGVTYGLSAKDSKEKFLADPAKYIEAAEKQRWENNFVAAMSRIWCPVTDEVNSGGGLIWNELGMEWESCCQFCNDTRTDEDFPRALDRLKKRAAEAYEIMGKAIYTEGATSPVQGAIKIPGMDDDEEEAESGAGCAPTYLSEADLEPTWAGGIALVFENRCIECHRAGGAAPMSFQTLGQLGAWKAKMKDAIKNRTMPPWPADSGAFATGKRLTDQEIDLLNEWIDSGYPAGDGEPGFESAFAGDWGIGEPDHVFDLGEKVLGEDLGEHVAEYEIETGFDSDKIIVASEVRPTDTFLVLEIDAGPLGSYHVGNPITKLPEGNGYLLKQGETVKVRVFYTKEKGWEEYDDMTQIAVKFGDADTTVMKDRLANEDFTIPAGKDGVEASATFTFEADGTIHGVTPVLRQRGKTVSVVAKTPDGTETEIVNIPHWDPAWNFTYAPCEPIAAPKGTTVTITGTYDNTDMNAKNPNPEAEVKAGPGGELLEGWLTYSLD